MAYLNGVEGGLDQFRVPLNEDAPENQAGIHEPASCMARARTSFESTIVAINGLALGVFVVCTIGYVITNQQTLENNLVTIIKTKDQKNSGFLFGCFISAFAFVITGCINCALGRRFSPFIP